jgi:hypothetical protein
MSTYANKLSSLAAKKQKLLSEEIKLIEKRKQEIGTLAEKFNLLTASDALIIGLFSDAQIAVNDQSERIKLWETHGEKFLKPEQKPKQKSNSKAT